VAEALRLRAPGVDVRAAARNLALPCGGGRHVTVRKARARGARVTSLGAVNGRFTGHTCALPAPYETSSGLAAVGQRSVAPPRAPLRCPAQTAAA